MIKVTDGRPLYKQAITGAIKAIKLLIYGALIGNAGYILWSLGFVKSLMLLGVLVALPLSGVALIFVYLWASDGGIMPRDYCDYCHDDEPVTDTVMATESELPENFQPD